MNCCYCLCYVATLCELLPNFVSCNKNNLINISICLTHKPDEQKKRYNKVDAGNVGSQNFEANAN